MNCTPTSIFSVGAFDRQWRHRQAALPAIMVLLTCSCSHAAQDATYAQTLPAAEQLFLPTASACQPESALAVTVAPVPAQDKYLELAPEPLHIDEWWIDPRTRAALEASVGLGDHVTFTADQTRPLQLTRGQVRASAAQS